MDAVELLHRQLLEAEVPCRTLDAAIEETLLGGRRSTDPPRYSERVSDALAMIRELLPDFWVSSGLCSLSGHASMGPDYNGPAGDGLKEFWPEARFHGGFHSDLEPGDGEHRQCQALLDCAFQALSAKASLEAEFAADDQEDGDDETTDSEGDEAAIVTTPG